MKIYLSFPGKTNNLHLCLKFQKKRRYSQELFTTQRPNKKIQIEFPEVLKNFPIREFAVSKQLPEV